LSFETTYYDRFESHCIFAFLIFLEIDAHIYHIYLEKELLSGFSIKKKMLIL